MEGFVLPGWLAAIAFTCLCLAGTVRWVREIIKPVSTGGAGMSSARAEWRGKVEEILRQEQELTRQVTQMLSRQTEVLRDIHASVTTQLANVQAQMVNVHTQTQLLEEKLEVLASVWKHAIKGE